MPDFSRFFPFQGHNFTITIQFHFVLGYFPKEMNPFKGANGDEIGPW
jgi:hypothetical protein